MIFLPGMPNTAQPSAPPEPDWVDRPEGIPGCPPGLEYLLHVDQLLVKQQVEIFEGKSLDVHRSSLCQGQDEVILNIGATSNLGDGRYQSVMSYASARRSITS